MPTIELPLLSTTGKGQRKALPASSFVGGIGTVTSVTKLRAYVA